MLRRVARGSIAFSTHDESAPGPSPLGTGDVGTIQRMRLVRIFKPATKRYRLPHRAVLEEVFNSATFSAHQSLISD
jgi:hypothetical protein